MIDTSAQAAHGTAADVRQSDAYTGARTYLNTLDAGGLANATKATLQVTITTTINLLLLVLNEIDRQAGAR